jgi:hypothetical protein
MVTTDQLVAHLVGDFIAQSDWMALNKSKRSLPCAVHCLIYTACFAVFHPSPAALGVIFGTHFLIDRFGLARYLVWLKNWQSPDGYKPWRECAATGYSDDRPLWITVWLTIVADNTLHLLCNGAALTWL